MQDSRVWLGIKTIIGLIVIAASIAFGIWLCIWVMLYGGIMQAIENWGVNNSSVVWGIIRAIFFGIGVIPAYIGVILGYSLLPD